MRSKLSDTILQQLKQEILMTRLHPGDLLSEQALTERFHVSRTPVRQALQRLEALGLVEIRDGVGTFVTMITPKEMESAYQIRNAMEQLALRTSIYRIRDAELAELREKFERFQKQLSKGGYGAAFEDVTKADWALHDLIMERSENRLLGPTVEKVTLLLRRYQYSYITSYNRATEDHLKLIMLIQKKDLDAALKLLDEHLQFRPM